MSSNNPPPFDSDPIKPEGPFAGQQGQEYGQTLDTGRPAVAAAPSKVIVGLVMLVGFVGFVVYNLFSGDDDEKQVKETKKEVAPPAPPPELPPIAEIPKPPEPPRFEPPPIAEVPDIPIIEPEEDVETNTNLQERIQAPMLVFGGAGSNPLAADPAIDPLAAAENLASTDPNRQFELSVYQANSQVDQEEAQRLGDLSLVIAQGKIITAILETAINTQLPGPIRAIVSHDVYAEGGDEPIIPKGSRLIGTYNTALFGGQKRVQAVWTRVIRPDGVYIMVNSPLTDALGASGVEGIVDENFAEIFSRSLLTSLISIGIAIGADELIGGDVTTSTAVDGTTTSSGSAGSIATSEALRNLGAVTQDYILKYINVTPTIVVDQGTRVNVFVNRDLVFPPELSTATVIP